MKENTALKGQELLSFLILPIQRLPRYVMLLNDLLNHTEVEHRDHKDLTQALKTLQTTTDYVNEQKRASENIDLISKIQKKIVHCPNLVEPHRRFLKEGYLYDLNHRKERFFDFTQEKIQSQILLVFFLKVLLPLHGLHCRLRGEQGADQKEEEEGREGSGQCHRRQEPLFQVQRDRLPHRM